MNKAKQIIDVLLDRKGFDYWWDDIQTEDQEDILKEIAKVIDD